MKIQLAAAALAAALLSPTMAHAETSQARQLLNNCRTWQALQYDRDPNADTIQAMRCSYYVLGALDAANIYEKEAATRRFMFPSGMKRGEIIKAVLAQMETLAAQEGSRFDQQSGIGITLAAIEMAFPVPAPTTIP